MSHRPVIGSRLAGGLPSLPASLPDQTPPTRRHRDIFDEILDSWQESRRTNKEVEVFLRRQKLWEPAVLDRFQVGFAGRPRHVLPRSQSLCRLLVAMKILDQTGRNLLYNHLVVPLFDRQGFVTAAYARTLDEEPEARHLYPSALFGVLNPEGIPEGGEVIVTATVLDALTLLVLGMESVTSAFGDVGLLSCALKDLIRRRRVWRVLCAYPTWISDHEIRHLTKDLESEGIEIRRARVPGGGLNDLVVAGSPLAEIQALLRGAGPLEARGSK